MKSAPTVPFDPATSGTLLKRRIDTPLAANEPHPSADLLHSTSGADERRGPKPGSNQVERAEWPVRLERLDVERAAREMRRRYVAEMVRRLARAVAQGTSRAWREGMLRSLISPASYIDAGKHLAGWLRRITRSNDELHREWRERYLAQSTDLCDLERRQRELDRLPMPISIWG